MAHETKYWNTGDVLQKEGKRASKIEKRKRPYALAMDDEWEAMMKYYVGNPQELNHPLTVDKDTALHIAASCSKSRGKHVLKFLINLLPLDEKCRALRRRNKHGNNVLHEVAVSGNLDAAKFLLKKFNKPPAHVPSEETSCNDDENLHLLVIRNNLGESPIYRAAALGHTKLVQFFAEKLEEENPENFLRHFHRNDKMSILHIAIIAQKFETAHWLQKNYKFLAQRKEDKGLTSLQLLTHMPTRTFDADFQQSKWKMFIYQCLPVGELATPNHKDNDVVKDDVESSLGSESDQTPQSICRKKLAVAVFVNVYTSMWNFLAIVILKVYTFMWNFLKGQENGIIDKIWEDKKNKKYYLKELIRLLVEEDNSWEDSTTPKDKTISLWSEGNHNKKGRDSAAPTKSKEQIIYTYTPLLIATITGFVPIVKEILEKHPQAAEHISDDGQNILHLAIKYRQEEILRILKRNLTTISRLKARIDDDGNTILHQAADRSYYSIATAQDKIGPAMQLQYELKWTLRVQDMVPPHYTIHRNNKGQTAEKLFNKEHNKLLKSAQDWIKETAQACSTVAVLVAGVVLQLPTPFLVIKDQMTPLSSGSSPA